MKFNKNGLLSALSLSLAMGFIGTASVFAASPSAVNLGSAANFVILSKTGVSTTGATSVVGNIGLSPAAASYITGFALTLPAASAFSTTALVTGNIYAPGYANPTPADLTTAVGDMQTAYTDAAGRAADVTELGAGNIGGLTLVPGVYKWGTGVTIPTDVTISGGANDVWIFQIAQNLNISSATNITLAGGAQANNIFWVVAGQTTIGTTAIFNGNILDQTAIVLNTGAKLNGRALAQTAVTLDSNAVVLPSGSVSATPATPAVSATPAVTASGTSGQTVSATPATPAVSATPSSQSSNVNTTSNSNSSTDTGCASGNKFSITTGRSCAVVPNYDTGCLPGNNFSITTGFSCSGATVNNASVADSNFGKQVRMITANLSKGSNNSNVKALQQFLISQNKGPASLALAANGVTSFFGEKTRLALAEFQAQSGITPATGYFGALTRAYISANY